MARVTIEECLDKVNSHFDLVLVAAERAKQISSGRTSEISKKGIKSHVTALREIEQGNVSVDILKENLKQRFTATEDILDDEKEELNEDNKLEELNNAMFIPGEVEEINITESMFDKEIILGTDND